MFFVTAIRFNDPESTERGLGNTSRTFGYFEKRTGALQVVDRNTGDLQEKLYNFLVIENISEGIHSISESEDWFKWDYESNHWERIEKPEFSKGITNWGSVG